MIFHNLRTITVGDFSEMVTYSDLSKLKRRNVPVPKRMLKRAYSDIILEWNKLNNSDKLEKEIRESGHKIKLLTQLNIQYPIMLKMLRLVAKYNNKKAKELLNNVYIKVYNKEPKTADDYLRIYKDIDLKIRKYKQRYGNEQKEEKTDSFDFEKLITNIELILAPLQIREKKMYTLPRYIDIATNKIKHKENG